MKPDMGPHQTCDPRTQQLTGRTVNLMSSKAIEEGCINKQAYNQTKSIHHTSLVKLKMFITHESVFVLQHFCSCTLEISLIKLQENYCEDS